MENIDNLILDELLNDDDDDNEDELEDLLIPVINDQGLINIVDIGVEDAPILRNLIHGDRQNGILNFYYYEHVIPRYNDNQFHSHFRMSRELYEELENLIYRQIRQGENNVPLRKKILLTIYGLLPLLRSLDPVSTDLDSQKIFRMRSRGFPRGFWTSKFHKPFRIFG